MKKLAAIFPILLLLLSFQSSKNDIAHGKQLFIANCAMCHHPANPSTGPALKFIRKDLDTKWIFTFIRNHDSFAKSEDIRAKYVHTIYRQTSFNETYHHLSNDDLNAILNYVDTFSGYNPKHFAHRKLPVHQIQSILYRLDTMQFEDPFKRIDYLDSLAGK